MEMCTKENTGQDMKDKVLIQEAQSGNNLALEELVKNNQRLIWSVVRRFYDRGYDFEDLFQIGAIGFIKAIKNFDISYETKLSTYAVPLIIGEIKRFIRDDGFIKVSRRIKELRYKVYEIENENEKHGRETDINELITKLAITKEELMEVLEFDVRIDSLDKSVSEEDDTLLGEKIAFPKNEFANVLNRIEIQKGFSILNSREKKVIYYRFYKDKKQGEIAKMLGVTQVQISRIEKKAIEKMRQCLT